MSSLQPEGTTMSAADPAVVSRPGGRGRPMLDLRAAVARQLVAAGVDAAAVSTAPWCTACRDDLFFSYRRQAERAGRMLSLIGWTVPPAGVA